MNMTNKGSKYDFTLSGQFLGTTHGNLPGSLQFLPLIQVSSTVLPVVVLLCLFQTSL